MTYARLALQAPYILGVFKPKQRRRVLQIGLGGGVTGAFLEWLPEKVCFWKCFRIEETWSTTSQPLNWSLLLCTLRNVGSTFPTQNTIGKLDGF